MRYMVRAFVMTLVFASSVMAQNTYPKWEIPLTFSYANVHRDGRAHFFGYQTGLDINFNQRVGLTIDLAGQVGSHDDSTGQFLIGPRFTKRREGTTGFWHILAGSVSRDFSGSQRTGVAFAVGGGFDIGTGDRVAFRAFQADYIPYRIGGRWRNDIRVQTGVVFTWGYR